jgi:N-acyl-D-amino-acid deacylase
MELEVLLKGGLVVDVDRKQLLKADVGIQGERVAAVGHLQDAAAAKVLDCQGLVLVPGFIDVHVHADAMALADPDQEAALRQGVTTYIIGQDGSSYAPGGPAVVEFFRRYTAGFNGAPDIGWDWNGVADYLARFHQKTAVNIAFLVPHGNLRLEVIGPEERRASPAEIHRMQALLEQGLEEGAVGFSTGLEYIPSGYADTNELVELARTLSGTGLPYVSHVRSYAPDRVRGALEEVRRIGLEAKVPVHVSHFNVRAREILPWVDQQLQDGLDLTFDTYPYLAGSTILAMVALPRWVQEGGVELTLQRLRDPSVRKKLRPWFENPPTYQHADLKLTYIASPHWARYEGMMLPEAAREAGLPVGGFICEVLLASDLAVGVVHFQRHRTEADLHALMRHPAHMAASDAIFVGGFPHPRGWGAFARFAGRFVQEGLWELPEAVWHCSTHAAERYQLRDRGRIVPGAVADIACLEPTCYLDQATFEAGRRPATGVRHVLVNGVPALESGVLTGARSGKVLKPVP